VPKATDSVSPELVLVDPELARAERARLDQRASPAADEASPWPGAAAGGDERKDVPGGRVHRFRPAIALVALLFAALVAGGLATAWSLAGDHGGGSPQQGAPIAAPPAAPQSVKPTAVYAGRADRLPSAHRLERRLLALLAGAPTSKLPRQLVDVGRRSARTDLRAVCRRSGARTFRCVIRSPRRPPNEGLYVRYRMRPSGEGFFEWLAYRR
jgi:hypothetical protein